jgi:hypothetical protein
VSAPTAPSGQHSCGIGINAPCFSHFPPYPPQQGLRQFLGIAGQTGGGFGPFSPKGTRGEPRKPVDWGACNYVSSGSTKRRAAFARFELPHFARFVPHIGSFRPHALFCRFARSYLSIYLFLEREDRKEGGGSRKRRSTLLKTVTKVYPRIFCVSTPFLWMGDGAAAQCWSGFAGIWSPIHTSTRGNALGRALTGSKGGNHG